MDRFTRTVLRDLICHKVAMWALKFALETVGAQGGGVRWFVLGVQCLAEQYADAFIGSVVLEADSADGFTDELVGQCADLLKRAVAGEMMLLQKRDALAQRLEELGKARAEQEDAEADVSWFAPTQGGEKN